MSPSGDEVLVLPHFGQVAPRLLRAKNNAKIMRAIEGSFRWHTSRQRVPDDCRLYCLVARCNWFNLLQNCLCRIHNDLKLIHD